MFPPQHFQGQLILIYCNHASLPSIILLVFPGRTHLLIIQILSACLDIYRMCVCVCVCVCVWVYMLSHSVMSDSLQPHSLPGYSVYGDSPGKNTRVGCHALLQGIFSTQGSNPGLPYFRQIIYQLSHKRSPTILEWVAYPFSRGPSQPRNWTRVSCIADGFFTSWATMEAQ